VLTSWLEMTYILLLIKHADDKVIDVVLTRAMRCKTSVLSETKQYSIIHDTDLHLKQLFKTADVRVG
jgi:hypothetical protein